MSEQSERSLAAGGKTSGSNVYCSVYGCKSKYSDNPDLSFHYFPKSGNFVNIRNAFGNYDKIDRHEVWIRKLKMGKTPSGTMRVCSLHFKNDDYHWPTTSKKSRKVLKLDAVPSQNLPLENSNGTKTTGNSDRSSRIIRRNKQKESNSIIKESTTNYNPSLNANNDDNLHQQCQHISNENQSGHNENDVDNRGNVESAEQFQDKATQITNEDIAFFLENDNCKKFEPYFKRIKSDVDLCTLTGISNFKIFRGIINLIKEVAPTLRNAKVCLEDKVIMTYMKFKHNISYLLLKVHFNVCTVQACTQIIKQMIEILSYILKCAVIFPSTHEISRNMPLCFIDFLDVQVSLDCTEVQLETPQNLCCKIFTWSHYKGNHTAKVMTAVSPSGNIVFVSKAYGGRTSDKAIFTLSNFIQLIEPGGAKMTDRGFLIDDICKDRGVKLVRPPFMRDKVQFSHEEAVLNAKIASARVHVERSNQRIKSFKILSNKFPKGLIPQFDEVFTIICGTINLELPILKDDKFFSTNCA